MNKKYKLNKEWLDLLLESKNNENITFNLSNNDTKILLTYIEILQQENQELKLELSGYRQAILDDKEMLGLKEKKQKYKEVIDKVIEYLEEPNRDSFDYSKVKLLDILKEVSE